MLKKNAFIVMVLVILIGSYGAFLLAGKVKQEVAFHEALELRIESEQVVNKLQKTIDIELNRLIALKAFYEANDQVTQEQFGTFADVLLNGGQEVMSALAWVPVVIDEQRLAFEQTLQISDPAFVITQRNPKQELINSDKKSMYYPIAYIHPYQSNQVIHGFDISSNDVLRQWLEQVHVSEEIASTATVNVFTKEKAIDFVTLLPVLEKGKVNNKQLEGFLLGFLDIESLVRDTVLLAGKYGFDIALVDVNKEGGRIIWGTLMDEQLQQSGRFLFDLRVPQQNWSLYIFPVDKKIISPNSFLVEWVFYTGLIISFLLGLCAFGFLRAFDFNQSLQDANSELEATIASRTEELEMKNSKLVASVDTLEMQQASLDKMVAEAKSDKEKLERKAVELVRTNKELDEFAYIASHDLRSPLRGIDQLACWVEEDIAEGNMEEVSNNLQMIRKRVKRLEVLLNDLLAYSRVGKENVVASKVNTTTLVKDLFELCAAKDFLLIIEGELPVFYTHLAPFERILYNLLNNAVKHHDSDKGSITIGCKTGDQYFQFSVHDDGPGIAVEHHERVFHMFKTLRPRDEVEGSGMGLAIIRKIVEHYGGTVILESTLGVGTTFTFTWPKVIDNSVVVN